MRKNSITTRTAIYLKLLVLITTACCFWLKVRSQQRDIVLSGELQNNMEQLPVKIGAQWMGKIAKFSFGNYSITNSKAGWTTTKTNLWNTKTESKSSQKFSFELSNGSGLTAACNAITKISGKEIRAFNLGTSGAEFDWVLEAQQNSLLSGSITLSNDTGHS
jgi:hypothetical protein